MRELIFSVVDSFYQKAIPDVLIGYHFDRFRDPDHLAPHLERLTTFWEMQLTGKATKSLGGKPFNLLFTHIELRIRRGELGRWIILFHKTLDELEEQFRTQASPEDLQEIQLITTEWKKKIAFFEERFKSHPMMFRSPT